MEGELVAGNNLEAAAIAIENTAFYNVTLKNFAAPWTNRDQTVLYRSTITRLLLSA